MIEKLVSRVFSKISLLAIVDAILILAIIIVFVIDTRIYFKVTQEDAFASSPIVAVAEPEGYEEPGADYRYDCKLEVRGGDKIKCTVVPR